MHKFAHMIDAFANATASTFQPHLGQDWDGLLKDQKGMLEVPYAGLPHCELSLFTLLALLA
jgi:hypothetical protein